MDRETLHLYSCNTHLNKLVALSYAFNPNQPRDDYRNWVPPGEIEAAKQDPATADAIRERMSDPNQLATLERGLAARPEPQPSDAPLDWLGILAALNGPTPSMPGYNPPRPPGPGNGVPGGPTANCGYDDGDMDTSEYGAEPSSGINPAKAKQILRDDSAQGHPLTEKQKGMFGAAAGRDDNARYAVGEGPIDPLMAPPRFQGGGVDVNPNRIGPERGMDNPTEADCRSKYSADPRLVHYSPYPTDPFGRPRGVMDEISMDGFLGGKFGAKSDDGARYRGPGQCGYR